MSVVYFRKRKRIYLKRYFKNSVTLKFMFNKFLLRDLVLHIPIIGLRRETEHWVINFVKYDIPRLPILKELESNKMHLV